MFAVGSPLRYGCPEPPPPILLFIILPTPRRSWGLGPPARGDLVLAARSLGDCAEEEPSPQSNPSRREVAPSLAWRLGRGRRVRDGGALRGFASRQADAPRGSCGDLRPSPTSQPPQRHPPFPGAVGPLRLQRRGDGRLAAARRREGHRGPPGGAPPSLGFRPRLEILGAPGVSAEGSAAARRLLAAPL